MLMPREAAPQVQAGRDAGAQAPCRVAVLLEQRAAGVPHANNAAQMVGGQQHCVVLAASCFHRCNKAVGAVYIGVVHGLAAANFTLEAGDRGGVPSPHIGMVDAALWAVRQHKGYAAYVVVAGGDSARRVGSDGAIVCAT